MRLQNDGQAELTFVVGARSLAHGLASDTCRLSSLDLRLNYIADEGATELYRVLTLRNRSLTTLNVSSNLCTGMSTGALAKMLRHNDCVTRLDVSSNNLAVSHKGSTKFSVENCFPCPSPRPQWRRDRRAWETIAPTLSENCPENVLLVGNFLWNRKLLCRNAQFTAENASFREI